jgi:hypothetical protein
VTTQRLDASFARAEVVFGFHPEGAARPQPSKTDSAALNLARERTTKVAPSLLYSLVITAAHRDREVETAGARIRAAARFGR